ncbi:hypothetical protein AGMMS50293_30490 [Spirochaetia bacterium]|nr:hypothetical protein AGMMS50293_30490 [Spirochaetia bacterium]
MADCAILIKEIQSLPPSSWGKVLDFVEQLKQSNVGNGSDPAGKGTNLSGRFAGALRVSDERYAEMQQELQAGREEWNRNTF